MADFAGKTVMVVGGSRGIGAAIVAGFAQAGARVGFTYVGSDEAARSVADASGSTAIRCDAADGDALRVTIADAGRIDILVYSAGLLMGGDPLTIAPDVIDRMIDVNVRGAYHACVEAARTMPDGGRMIVIGSVNADRVPTPGISAYAMTKSAMQGMARGLARDFGPRDITINVVQPGPTDTQMNPADGPMAETLHDLMALPRHGRPEDVAHFVLYLAGPHAAGITGSMHMIDGGFSA